MENAYEQYKDRLHVNEDQFLSDMRKSKERLTNGNGVIIISETFDGDLQRDRYSLHHATNIVGVAMYIGCANPIT